LVFWSAFNMFFIFQSCRQLFSVQSIVSQTLVALSGLLNKEGLIRSDNFLPRLRVRIYIRFQSRNHTRFQTTWNFDVLRDADWWQGAALLKPPFKLNDALEISIRWQSSSIRWRRYVEHLTANAMQQGTTAFVFSLKQIETRNGNKIREIWL